MHILELHVQHSGCEERVGVGCQDVHGYHRVRKICQLRRLLGEVRRLCFRSKSTGNFYVISSPFLFEALPFSVTIILTDQVHFLGSPAPSRTLLSPYEARGTTNSRNASRSRPRHQCILQVRLIC